MIWILNLVMQDVKRSPASATAHCTGLNADEVEFIKSLNTAYAVEVGKYEEGLDDRLRAAYKKIAVDLGVIQGNWSLQPAYCIRKKDLTEFLASGVSGAYWKNVEGETSSLFVWDVLMYEDAEEALEVANELSEEVVVYTVTAELALDQDVTSKINQIDPGVKDMIDSYEGLNKDQRLSFLKNITG